MKKNYAKQIVQVLFDLLFPKYCLGCEKIGHWLCADCQQDKLAVCLTKREVEASEFVDHFYYVADFDQPLISKIVKTCKYQGVAELAVLMGQKMAEKIGDQIKEREFQLLPVPLHQRRLRSRGFNQSEIMASEISRVIGNGMMSRLVTRMVNRPAQAKLTRAERLSNLQATFSLANKADLSDYGLVIIVDDVVTTGSTMNEIAKILKGAGVKEVWGLAFAHGS